MSMETLLIALVFASQIGVLSFYAPHRRRRNHEIMTTRYPPAEYPRLYPVPKAAMDRGLQLLKSVHLVLGVGALVVLIAGLAYAQSPGQFGEWMLACLGAQILPVYVTMPWMIKMSRALRNMPLPNVRSMELRQWRIVDFVSPFWIALGCILPGLAVVCAGFIYRHPRASTLLVAYCVIVSSALLLRMAWLLFHPVPLTRPDPYMSPEDTFWVRSLRYTMLFRAGAVFGAFFIVTLLYSVRLLDFDFGYFVVGLSVLFQMVWLRFVSVQSQALRTRDFSVYRVGV